MNFRHILGALALIASATTAHAQVSVSASTVDLTALNEHSYYPPNFSLLSDQNGVAKFSLNSYGAASWWETNYGQTGDYVQEYFTIGLHAGHRLTGFSITGQFNGQTYVYSDNNDGSATNSLGVYASITAEPYGQSYVNINRTINNLNGQQNMYLGASGLDLTGNKVLQLNAAITVIAVPTTVCNDGGCRQENSFSSIRLNNPVLTLNTQPVPEPETYAMMGIGLLLLGVVARRRKQV
ncbi:MAG: hypothetical protein RL748_1809 [Pseudomonadota bacterium]|jgi:hypothetical protein